MKAGKELLIIAAKLAFVGALALPATMAFAQNRDHQDRNHQDRDQRHDGDRRDWDRGRDHSDRDRNWDQRHRWRPNARVVDYPDYSAWHIQGGLYPVDRLDDDRRSSTSWRRQRSAFFAHAWINLGGHSYARVLVDKGGRQYYSFRFSGG